MRERCVWADALRVLASFMVVLLHCSIYGIYMEPQTATWWFSNAYDAVCRIAVPLFLILSGYFWHGKKGWNIHKIARLVLIYVFWQLFYYVINGIITGDIRELKSFALDFLRNVFIPYNHLWYLPYLVAIWVIAPLITKISRTVLAILSIVFIVTTSVVSLLGLIGEDNCLAGVVVKLIWCEAYFLVGFLIRSLPKDKEISMKALLGTVLIMTCMTIVGTGIRALSGIQPVYILYEYGMINVAAMSTCVFACFAKTNYSKAISSIARLHEYTLGIYLVHVAIRNLLVQIISEAGVDIGYFINPVGIFLLAVIIWTISLLVTYIFTKLPVIRRTVML